MKTLLLLLPLLATTTLGCATDECERALADIQDKATECNLPGAADYDVPTNQHDRKCDAADSAELQRQATCTTQATCEALDGTDTAGNRAYAACVAGP